MDWVTVLVRFALYLDLMLVFGLPCFTCMPYASRNVHPCWPGSSRH